MTRGVAAATALITLLVTLSACAPQSAPDPVETSAFSLTVGDCTGADAATTIDSVRIIDCEKPHQFEVYASVVVPAEAYPGAGAIEALADPQCRAEFERFIGIPRSESSLAYDFLYPTEQSWQAGDREVLCRVTELDDGGEIVPHRGSLRGAAR